MSLLRRIVRALSKPGEPLHQELHPEEYYRCTHCKEGPWHRSWLTDNFEKHGAPKRGLCPNCSGAD